MIHGVDSLKLLDAINRSAQQHKRCIDCLLQVRIAQEETKFGLSGEDALTLVHSEAFRNDEACTNQGSHGDGKLYRK